MNIKKEKAFKNFSQFMTNFGVREISRKIPFNTAFSLPPSFFFIFSLYLENIYV